MKVVAALTALLLYSGCTDQGLPPDDTLKPAVTVQFLEASCTEVWLGLAPRNVSPPYTLTLLRDDSAVATLSSPPADTTVIDEGLAPSRTYIYRARLASPSGLDLIGEPVQTRTLDTTSHQFTWEATVLGDGGSSIFYDVAIVNDTLAYAVGEVYLRDSSGVLETLPYNLAVWNGSTWSLRRVTVPFRGQMITVPLEGVFAHSARDIWLVGGLAIHGDGVSWTPYDVRLITGYNGLSFTRCWGSSSRDMWFTGRVGSLVHFDGITWRRVESGTTVPLLDVWGSPGGTAVWAAGWEDFAPTVLLRLRVPQAEVAYRDPDPFVQRTDSLSGILTSVYTNSASHLFVASMYGLYRIPSNSPLAAERYSFVPTYFPGFPYRVRGTDANNLTIVGEFGMVAHFNGMTWRHFDGLMSQDRRLRSVAMRGNLAIAVGAQYHQPTRSALVFVGRR